MKILIISDTHGSHKNFDRVIEKERPLDMLIHLGDVEGMRIIFRLLQIVRYIWCVEIMTFSNLPGEEEFMVEGYHIFTTHGHGYYVSMGETRLKQEARGRGADIVMYGHTHRPFYEKEEGLITLNPGSLCYPRQPGRKPSYMIMQIDSNGKLEITQEYLN